MGKNLIPVAAEVPLSLTVQVTWELDALSCGLVTRCCRTLVAGTPLEAASKVEVEWRQIPTRVSGRTISLSGSRDDLGWDSGNGHAANQPTTALNSSNDRSPRSIHTRTP